MPGVMSGCGRSMWGRSLRNSFLGGRPLLAAGLLSQHPCLWVLLLAYGGAVLHYSCWPEAARDLVDLVDPPHCCARGGYVTQIAQIAQISACFARGADVGFFRLLDALTGSMSHR